MMPAIDWSQYFNIIVLTGAGISVASGLRPFRGENGIWHEIDVMSVATAAALRSAPEQVWQFNQNLRKQLQQAAPNAAHYALAKFARNRKAYQNFTLITQNVDGLHTRAGNQAVIEMHGNVNRIKCSNRRCKRPITDDQQFELTEFSNCNLCGRPLRHDVVLFGEDIAMQNQKEIKRSLRNCDLFIAIGTSGEVFPAAGFVQRAKSYGAKSLLINMQPLTENNDNFEQVIIGEAEQVLPKLLNGES